MENIIFVQNLSLFGIHGQDAISRKEKREFVFTIEATIKDISKAVETEDIRDVFDYKILIQEAEKVMAGSSCVLTETLASKIVDALLKYELVEKIKLTLFKRELLHGAMSGITLVRSN